MKQYTKIIAKRRHMYVALLRSFTTENGTVLQPGDYRLCRLGTRWSLTTVAEPKDFYDIDPANELEENVDFTIVGLTPPWKTIDLDAVFNAPEAEQDAVLSAQLAPMNDAERIEAFVFLVDKLDHESVKRFTKAFATYTSLLKQLRGEV